MSKGLLAGIGITNLHVYDQRPGPDGLNGGCAHVHAVTDEAYFVAAGTGAIDLHDLETGFRRVPLQPGSFVQFPPATLHRAISHGGLQVVCIMSNAGLAERGDARIYFGPEADADEALYRSFWRLTEKGLEGALERRDRSIAAYGELLKLWDGDRDAYRARLSQYIDRHMQAMSDIRPNLETIVQGGPAAWLDGALERLGQLPARVDAGTPERGAAGQGQPLLGMCGLLRPVHIDGPV